MRASRPENLAALRRILAEKDPDLRFIAGGTDLVPHLRRHPEASFHLLDLSHLEELRVIALDGTALEIGSATTFTEIEQSPLVKRFARALAVAASQVGSPQIRNRATLGGNVAHASPAADGIPALCCLGAQAVLEDECGKQAVLPVEKLLAENVLSPSGPCRLLRSFRIPLAENSFSDFAKLGSRQAVTISKLNLAFGCHIEQSRVTEPRLFVGAIAPRPIRATQAEEVLAATPRGEDSSPLADALETFVAAAIPTRASMPYKRRAIRGLAADLYARFQEALS